jgi:general secretion pathway protein J
MILNPPLDRRPGGAAGFTLLEMLVALTTLSILSVALFGGLRTGQRLQSAGSKQSEQLQQVATLHTMLRSLLAEVTPASDPARERDYAIVFHGDPDSVVFVAPMAARLNLGGLHWFRIGTEQVSNGRRLVLEWALFRPEFARPSDRAARMSVLLDRVKAIRWGYFGASPDSEAPRWREKWDFPGQLPLLVRLGVTFTDGRPMPDLVVALRRVGQTDEAGQ